MPHDSAAARPSSATDGTRLLLLGLDFGSTTSSSVLATARVLRNCATGRMEFGEPEIAYRSEPVFTPFRGEDVDEAELRALLERWMGESGIAWTGIGAGGAIVTGLAAGKRNARSIVSMVRERVPEALVVTADDPSLESWVAFMGSVHGLSAAHPEQPFLNLDVGGGTANFALGVAGEVRSVGCLFIGARHVRVVPGTYRIAEVSACGVGFLRALGIERGPGDELSPVEVAAIVDRSVRLLEAAVQGDPDPFREPWAAALVAVPFRPPDDLPPPVLTLSGGVGELAYAEAAGKPAPSTTYFGDLGIDLAQAIVRSPILGRDLRRFVPANLGRATVYGLALSSTEVSGTTLFLPRPSALPLRDLPIVARLPADVSHDRLLEALARAREGGPGACLQFLHVERSAEAVRRLGGSLARALAACAYPPERPLVVFVPGDVGKALGNYATDWGRLAFHLIVIDEMTDRRAHFASLGAPRHNVIPVSFYGVEPDHA